MSSFRWQSSKPTSLGGCQLRSRTECPETRLGWSQDARIGFGRTTLSLSRPLKGSFQSLAFLEICLRSCTDAKWSARSTSSSTLLAHEISWSETLILFCYSECRPQLQDHDSASLFIEKPQLFFFIYFDIFFKGYKPTIKKVTYPPLPCREGFMSKNKLHTFLVS